MLIKNNELLDKESNVLDPDTYVKNIFAPLNLSDLKHFNIFMDKSDDIEDKIIEFMGLDEDDDYIIKYREFDINDQILVNGYLIEESVIETKYAELTEFKFFSYLFNPLFLYEKEFEDDLSIVISISDESFIAYYYEGRLIDSRTYYSINEIAGIILSTSEKEFDLHNIESIIKKNGLNAGLYSSDNKFIYDELLLIKEQLLSDIDLGISKIEQMFGGRDFSRHFFSLNGFMCTKEFEFIDQTEITFKNLNKLSEDDNFNVFDVQSVYYKNNYFYSIVLIIFSIFIPISVFLYLFFNQIPFNEIEEMQKINNAKTIYIQKEKELEVIESDILSTQFDIDKNNEKINEYLKIIKNELTISEKTFFIKKYEIINNLLKKHNLKLEKIKLENKMLLLTIKSHHPKIISEFILDFNNIETISFEKIFSEENDVFTVLGLKL